MERFDIPVALIIFKREKAVEVLKRIAAVRPKKLYLLADQGRNDEEREQVRRCREAVENAINWDCEVIKNYAEENRGVYGNIALGAKWVFEREKWAIFLEDDNLPETTLFPYCWELLHRYEGDTRILWICGTNYLGKYEPEDGSSYVFTRHMLPCGWASWADKFNKFYDGDLKLVDDEIVLSRLRMDYYDDRIYKQYHRHWKLERQRFLDGKRFVSWDYQMNFALRANGLYGIAPSCNQIRNIGVDDAATHSGMSRSDKITKRICDMESYPISFPLKHPKVVLRDEYFERETSRIVLYPFSLVRPLSKIVRAVFRIPYDVTTKAFFTGILKRK